FSHHITSDLPRQPSYPPQITTTSVRPSPSHVPLLGLKSPESPTRPPTTHHPELPLFISNPTHLFPSDSILLLAANANKSASDEQTSVPSFHPAVGCRVGAPSASGGASAMFSVRKFLRIFRSG
ncbi:unnamed protein product, partial [Ectocarpus fasciculatus]